MKRFLTDLYRDLDDRHLLLPAIALLVAVIAVPFLLSSSSSAPPVSIAPPASSPGTDVMQSAVLTENPGVRNYRHRLEQFKSKNPFQARIAAPSTAQTGKLEVNPPADGTGTVGTSEPTGSTPPVTSSGTGSTVTTSSGSSTSSSTTSGSSTTGGTTSPSSGSQSKPHRVIRFYEWQADVKVGVPGELEERDGVSNLDVLPGKARPIFIYAGATIDGSKALFTLSSDAGKPDGSGTCLPASNDCQYLVLKKGQSETVEYAPDGKRYKLALLRTHRVLVDTKHH
jgi:hypothetical protein